MPVFFSNFCARHMTFGTRLYTGYRLPNVCQINETETGYGFPGIAKQRKEGSFRERKSFVRKEHFIIIAIDI